jgi:N-acetylglutamate synthase/N-acetylornithine aminotransferase
LILFIRLLVAATVDAVVTDTTNANAVTGAEFAAQTQKAIAAKKTSACVPAFTISNKGLQRV